MGRFSSGSEYLSLKTPEVAKMLLLIPKLQPSKATTFRNLFIHSQDE